MANLMRGSPSGCTFPSLDLWSHDTVFNDPRLRSSCNDSLLESDWQRSELRADHERFAILVSRMPLQRATHAPIWPDAKLVVVATWSRPATATDGRERARRRCTRNTSMERDVR